MTNESPLPILMLEDNPTDAELAQELLEADQLVCEVTRVQTRAEFLTGLESIELASFSRTTCSLLSMVFPR